MQPVLREEIEKKKLFFFTENLIYEVPPHSALRNYKENAKVVNFMACKLLHYSEEKFNTWQATAV